jgi:hypothetical protein
MVKGKGKKKLTVQGVPKVIWTGEYRNMLWVPDDKRQEGRFMKLTWTLIGIAAVLCAPFVNIVCWCKSGALPLVLSCIGLKRGEDGEVVVDPETTNFKDLLEIDQNVPDYAAASYKPARVLVEAGLVSACLSAPKNSWVPKFLCRGNKEIQDLGYPVVEAYGTDLKVLDYQTGNWIEAVMIEKPKKGRTVIVGVAHPDKGIASSFCVQTSEYALRFPESPLLIARGKVGEERGLAVAQAYVQVIGDIYVRDSYLGYAYPGVSPPYRPSPPGGAHSAAALLAAVAAFLPSTHAHHRQREFDDLELEVVTSCGGGEWPTRILTLDAFVWLVLVALANDIPVPEENRKDEKAAVAAARAAWADDERRPEIEALFAKVLPPKGLGKAGRDLVVAALEKGVRGNEIVLDLEGAHALCAEDSPLRALVFYLRMRQGEREAAVCDAVALKMKLVVGPERWEEAEANRLAAMRAERAAAKRAERAAATVPSKAVSWASTLALEAAAKLEAKKEEEATFEFAVVRTVDDVVERAPSKSVLFRDVRKAVAARLRTDAPHFGKEIEQLATGASGTFGVKTLKGALRNYRIGSSEPTKIYDACLCERLPAVAGAAPSSPRTAPVSARGSPSRSPSPLSFLADAAASFEMYAMDLGGGSDSSGDEMAP